jgi:hypothetical protein
MCGPCGRVERTNVLGALDSGEPLCEDCPSVLVGFALPHDPVACSLESKIDSSDPAEERSDMH